MQEEKAAALRAALTAQALPFVQNEPLAAHTTFKIGGPAAFWCAPRDIEALRSTQQLCRENGVRVYLLGNGSNTLFDDAGFDGAVIDMRALSEMRARRGGRRRCAHHGGCGADPRPPVQSGAAVGADRAGICLRHPRHGGRCSLYERGRLRRRAEGRHRERDLPGQRSGAAHAACGRAGHGLPHQHF